MDSLEDIEKASPMNRTVASPPVRCRRCGQIIMEAQPTRGPATCHRCLGLSWEPCPVCGGERQHGACPKCQLANEDCD